MDELYITIENAAKYANVTEEIIQQWITLALLPSYDIDSLQHVHIDELEILLRFRKRFATQKWREELQRAYGNGAARLMRRNFITYTPQNISSLQFQQYHHKRSRRHLVDALFISQQFRVIDGDYIVQCSKQGAYLVWYNRGSKLRKNYLRIIEKAEFEQFYQRSVD